MSGIEVRDLVSFAIERLASMQLGDGSFREPRIRTPRRTDDRHSTRQTAIVLLGLLKAEEHGISHPFHTGGLRARLLDDAGQPGCSLGDLALILRGESRLDGAAAPELVDLLSEAVNVDGPGVLSGSELAWLISALTEASAREKLPPEGAPIAAEARDEVLARQRDESGLFEGPGHGPGRRFQSFESQIQLAACLLQLHELDGDAGAGEIGMRAAASLLEIQREDGSWPAVIDVRRLAPVEPYPLTTVNQVALAPMGLGAAPRVAGDPRYMLAALSGMRWASGENELEQVMLDRATGSFYRAIARRERLDRAHLFARAAASFFKPIAGNEARRTLRLDETSHPADLGWILEAWAGSEHLAEVAA